MASDKRDWFSSPAVFARQGVTDMIMEPMRRSALFTLLFVLLPTAARAQTPHAEPPENGSAPPSSPASGPSADTGDAPPKPLTALKNPLPPPSNVVYLQYGVAFAVESVIAPGPICDNVSVPCIFGSGGGVAVRAGRRGTGHTYFGGSYEFSKQDPQKILRLAILQQVRFEGRYYLTTGRDVQPYGTFGGGLATYGNEWGIDTLGPTAFLGIGVEAQLTRRTVVGLALAYRGIYFQKFTDSTGSDRAAGISQIFGLDLVLEQRDPIFTYGDGGREKTNVSRR